MKKVVNVTYLCLGFICLAIGAAGLVLPVLPGTPILLLAGFFFVRSSERVYQWMLGLPGIGPVVLDWQRTKSIKPSAKIWSMIYLWAALAFSMYRLYPKWPLIIMLAVIGTSVSLFISTRPSK
jgi:uncharacterized membrane protein YbaN (DUF454 family)